MPAKANKTKQVKPIKVILKHLALVAIVVGSFAGGKAGHDYYKAGLPKLKVGDCFMDQSQLTAGHIDNIIPGSLLVLDSGTYEATLQVFVFLMKGRMPIREFNKNPNVQKISCEDGTPIQ